MARQASAQAALPLKPHPLADLSPLLEGDEFDELVVDIRRHGVREPIVLYHGLILDGRNRYRAAQAAGVPCPTRVCEGYDPAAFVVSANIHRRHLTAEQRRGLIAALLKADPTKSNRQVAKIAGVSHPHVAKVREEQEQAGDVETVTTSVDSKGRAQPAHKPAPKPAPDVKAVADRAEECSRQTQHITAQVQQHAESVTVGAPKQPGLVEESIAARPTNLIVSAWQAATDEQRRYFVHVYYDALAAIVEQIGAEAPAEAADGEPPPLDLRSRAGVAS